MPTGWDSILTVISFGDCYTDGLEMLLGLLILLYCLCSIIYALTIIKHLCVDFFI